jgi:DNA processing protein
MSSSQNLNLYLLGFALTPNFTVSKYNKIIKYFGSWEKAWKTQSSEAFIQAGLKPISAKNIIEAKTLIDLQKETAELVKESIIFISIEDPRYPSQLKEISNAPAAIFCKGNIRLLNQLQLGVVGTRKPTNYGMQVCEKLVGELARYGIVITSGLAFGIDALSHKITIKNHGYTIAVLGNGLHSLILKQSGNHLLAEEIIANDGLLISEYPPKTSPSAYTFPARNRIISGLSKGILVIEAGEKSGTLITANHALEQNREIFAVPGNIFSLSSSGTNRLIKQGAQLVQNANDILEAFRLSPAKQSENSKKNLSFDDELEEKIYNLLSFEPLHINLLVKKLNADTQTIACKLSMLELKDLICSVNSGSFVRK